MSLYTETKKYENFIRRAGIKANNRDLMNLIDLDNGISHHGINKEKTRAMIISNIHRAITKLKNHKKLAPENREALSRYDGQISLDTSGEKLKEIGAFLCDETNSLKDFTNMQ